MKKIISACLLLFLFSSTARAEVMPDQLLRNIIGKISFLLQADRTDADDPRILYGMMDFCEQVLPHIDFHAMSKSALGRYWRSANPKQRAQFTREFRNQLIRVYGAALRKYDKQEIVYLPFFGKPGDKSTIVKTEVKQANDAPNVQISYSFYKVHSVWKLYDISIDGVSLVTTYANTYAALIEKEGIDALIAHLAKSNQAPVSAKHGAAEPAVSGKNIH